MKSPIPEYLKAVLENVRSNTAGAPASYIETLAKADPSKMAVALAMVDGKVYSAGDDQIEFSIQVSCYTGFGAVLSQWVQFCYPHELMSHNTAIVHI